MDVLSEELRREQKYFDAAWDHRERMRTNLGLAAGAAANSGAAARIKQDTQARLDRIGGSDEPVAFGRMDDESGERFYIGHHAIFDDDSEVLVMNWQAPAAARYYEASHADPRSLRLKRTYDCSMNRIVAFSDTVFAQLAEAVEELEAYEEISDSLLSDLESNRTGTMRDIVRTIQASQFDLIRADADQLTVIQGGPGTGKTAIALHRVSWLLFNSLGTLTADDILVVGPSPTFTRYTRLVLPSLGDTSVTQIDVHQLHPPVKRGRQDDPAVVKLKGDGRMAGLVRRALYGRVGPAEGQQWVEVQIGNRTLSLAAEEVKRIVGRARASAGTYSERRLLFRDLLTQLVGSRVRMDRSRLRLALDPVMDRLWPSYTPASFLRELYGSRDRLITAAGDEFTAREVSVLNRRPAERLSDETWSDSDLAVLDELDHLINGVEAGYLHVVVDEAQDLSPMQLRAIARRSRNGSMTVVGDIAQSTGHWARDDWDDLLDHLPADLPHVMEKLHYGYRVPRQVFDLAARLLPIAAPDVEAPQVVRDGPADPAIHRVEDEDERASTAVRVAMDHASHGRSVAIICPESGRADIERQLTVRDVVWRAASAGDLGPGVNVVSPQESKGLEFDAIVVVEPDDIIAEDDRGHRLLYVALTRTTRYLDIVCVRLPAELSDGSDDISGNPGSGEAPAEGRTSADVPVTVDEPQGRQLPDQSVTTLSGHNMASDPQPSPRPASRRFVDLGAEEVVALLRETVAPSLWHAVLSRAGELLDQE
ncbi:DNA helicase IV [Micromonospora sp. A200]|uniref:HelD family protein n=1 Tax=Micromonospora sp. A200 TaxID=2940568 RepID=UPI0024738C64|nr:ATP-binding domain-containing protein [Micromonospora sp. A200]MDH6462764.1 DNA helicase IV [Micromonospora sp. A200]